MKHMTSSCIWHLVTLSVFVSAANHTCLKSQVGCSVRSYDPKTELLAQDIQATSADAEDVNLLQRGASAAMHKAQSQLASRASMQTKVRHYLKQFQRMTKTQVGSAPAFVMLIPVFGFVLAVVAITATVVLEFKDPGTLRSRFAQRREPVKASDLLDPRARHPANVMQPGAAGHWGPSAAAASMFPAPQAQSPLAAQTGYGAQPVPLPAQQAYSPIPIQAPAGKRYYAAVHLHHMVDDHKLGLTLDKSPLEIKHAPAYFDFHIGDIVAQVNDTPVNDEVEFKKALHEAVTHKQKTGKHVVFVVLRIPGSHPFAELFGREELPASVALHPNAAPRDVHGVDKDLSGDDQPETTPHSRGLQATFPVVSPSAMQPDESFDSRAASETSKENPPAYQTMLPAEFAPSLPTEPVQPLVLQTVLPAAQAIVNGPTEPVPDPPQVAGALNTRVAAAFGTQVLQAVPQTILTTPLVPQTDLSAAVAPQTVVTQVAAPVYQVPTQTNLTVDLSPCGGAATFGQLPPTAEALNDGDLFFALIGTWTYRGGADEKYSYSISVAQDGSGDLNFQQQSDDGSSSRGVLRKDTSGGGYVGDLVDGDAQAHGTLRLRLKDARHAVSQFRENGSSDWLDEITAKKE